MLTSEGEYDKAFCQLGAQTNHLSALASRCENNGSLMYMQRKVKFPT
jgi:hypothetical protein